MVVMGPDELAAGQVKARNMQTHEEHLVDLAAAKSLLACLAAEPSGPEHLGIAEVFGGIGEGN